MDVDSGVFLQQTMSRTRFDAIRDVILFQAHQKQTYYFPVCGFIENVILL